MPIQTQILLVCMVMRNIQILPVPRVRLRTEFIITFADCPVFWQSQTSYQKNCHECLHT
jgi:hypothetical protein